MLCHCSHHDHDRLRTQVADINYSMDEMPLPDGFGAVTVPIKLRCTQRYDTNLSSPGTVSTRGISRLSRPAASTIAASLPFFPDSRVTTTRPARASTRPAVELRTIFRVQGKKMSRTEGAFGDEQVPFEPSARAPLTHGREGADIMMLSKCDIVPALSQELPRVGGPPIVAEAR